MNNNAALAKLTDNEIETKLQTEWGNFTEEIQRELGDLEKAYQKVFQRQRIAFGLFAVGILSIFLINFFAIGSPHEFILVSSLSLITFFIFVTALYFFWDRYGVVKEFNTRVNQLLFPKVFSIIGITGQYQKQSDTDYVLDALKKTELVTEQHNTNLVDDSFLATYQKQPANFYELNLKNITGSGKNRHVKHIFAGYLATFSLDKTFAGKTFVSTDGDRNGFGHRSYWSRLLGKGAIETKLEWNDFENLLHVAATDPTEARYILSPEFMAELYDWWQDKKQNIRISFIGNQLNILFPNNAIQFNQTVSKLATKELQRYAKSIMLPAMHIIQLVEEMYD